MTWITTATVLQQLRDYENREAWGSFSERFRRPVVSFAKSMGLAPADAEDVAQESMLAFAEAYRKGSYDPAKGRLSKFLFGIAYRQSLKYRRGGAPGAGGGKLAQVESGFWSEVSDDETHASGVWDTQWEASVLDDCLRQVRVEFEQVTFRAFDLVVREEKQPAEAAELLGITIKSVYNAKHRVLKRVRELRDSYESQV
jgi:RNA polymerase sigma-70 factor (ECF subfamily)